jgi:hypothetical protein
MLENENNQGSNAISIESLNTALTSYIPDYEKDLHSSISKMTGKKGEVGR